MSNTLNGLYISHRQTDRIYLRQFLEQVYTVSFYPRRVAKATLWISHGVLLIVRNCGYLLTLTAYK